MSFGWSVGDFLAVGSLIVKVVDALRGTRGEYQELIRELESLQRALTQVERLNETGGQAAAVDRIKSVALTCRYPLEEFLNSTQKYDKSLGLGSSVGKVRDAGKKIQYAFWKRDEANKLRKNLSIYTGIINMLLTERGLELLAVASKQTDKNQEELRDMFEDSSRELREVKGNLKAQALAVRWNWFMMRNLLCMFSGEIEAPLKSLSQTVTKIWVLLQNISTVVLEMRDSFRGIETRFTYFQAPVRVEDALGRVFPFPSEFSIEALTAEIKARFRGVPGQKEVMAGDFEIFNADNTGQLLTTSGRNVLLPGMSVNMAIVFEYFVTGNDKCPMPHCASKTVVQVIGGGKTCSECKVWFDGTSKQHERWGPVFEYLRLAKRNRHEAKRLISPHPYSQELRDLTRAKTVNENEFSDFVETLSAFRRIKYYTSFAIFTDDELLSIIDLFLRERHYSFAQDLSLLKILSEICVNGLGSPCNKETIRQLHEERRAPTIASQRHL